MVSANNKYMYLGPSLGISRVALCNSRLMSLGLIGAIVQWLVDIIQWAHPHPLFLLLHLINTENNSHKLFGGRERT